MQRLVHSRPVAALLIVWGLLLITPLVLPGEPLLASAATFCGSLP